MRLSTSLKRRFSTAITFIGVIGVLALCLNWNLVRSATRGVTVYSNRDVVENDNQVGNRLIQVLDNPAMSFSKREEAARTLAKMKFLPAIPALFRNWTLADPKDQVWSEDQYYPCRVAFESFGQAAYPYLLDTIHDPTLIKHQTVLAAQMRRLKRLPETIAAIKDELNQPIDPQVEKALRAHLVTLKSSARLE